MQRYGGRLIFHDRDDDGPLEVVDAFGVRALHFGTSPRQSAMSLSDPGRLELGYVRAMFGALLFAERPSRALVVGLGGGSLAKFLLTHYPDCCIDAVERRRAVVDIARHYFGLTDTERLTIHVADAADFLAEMSTESPKGYDLILVDAYDSLGMDPSINADGFFADCVALQSPHGVLSINLWGTHRESMRRSTELLNAHYPRRAFKLPVPNKGNIIGFGLGEALGRSALTGLSAKAMELEIQLGLEMRYFLRSMRELGR